jgi:PKD repeat protein
MHIQKTVLALIAMISSITESVICQKIRAKLCHSYFVRVKSNLWTRRTNHRLILLIICFQAFYSDSQAQCLSGTYTIGGVSPDYVKINDAAIALAQKGICGPVIFNIRNGVYNEQVSVGAVTGINIVSTVTFQSESKDSSQVIINFAGGPFNNYTFRFNVCSYIILRQVTLIASGTAYATAVRFEHGSNSNKVISCVLEGTDSTFSSGDAAVIHKVQGVAAGNSITGNLINKGSIGILYYGISSNVIIANNIFQNQYAKGVELWNLSGATVKANIFNSVVSSGSYTAVELNSCDAGSKIEQNKISIINGSYGIYLLNCNSQSNSPVRVANNFIHIGGTSGPGYGIYTKTVSFTGIYHNSVNITRPGTSARAFYQGGNTGNTYIRVANNIFAAPGGGYAFYVEQPAAINVSDHNDLFTLGVNVGFWGIPHSSLTAWKLYTGKDPNSVSANPYFVNDTSLYVRSYLLDNAGTPLAEVPSDIDGNLRNLVNPDIGASEWSTPVNDAGIKYIDQGLSFCKNNDSLYVVLMNFGTSFLTNVNINWEVNGVLQPSYAWSGVLPQRGTSNPIAIGIFNYTLSTAFTVKTWTSNPNGGTEGFHHNDTSIVINKYRAMSGIYTVGGTSPDYVTISQAVTDLLSGGVCGPVIINIRNGIYPEQIRINPVSGASTVNTITIQSEAGDSSLVILSYSPNLASNYVFAFNQCSYVTLKNITVRAYGSVFGTAVSFPGIPTHCRVIACHLESDTIGVNYQNINVVNLDNTCYYQPTFITLSGNRIVNGDLGIFIRCNYGISVSGNIIENQHTKGIYLINGHNAQITDNFISSNSTNTNQFGIQFQGYHRSSNVERNKIFISRYGVGIGIFDCQVNSPDKGIIANNFIWGRGTGIRVGGSHNFSFYNNSINATDIYPCLHLLTPTILIPPLSSNLQLMNNIFASTVGGYIFDIGQQSAITACNYNNMYTTGSTFAYLNLNFVSFTGWKIATGFDQNSIFANPGFFSSSDLHTTNPLLAGKGKPVTEIIEDIDYDLRHKLTPDIGADEFSNTATPTALFTFSPTVICAGNQITFTNTSPGPPTPVSWFFPGGIPSSSTQQNPSVVYNASGTYTASLVVTNQNGSDSIARTINITFIAPPVQPGAINGLTTVCSGSFQRYFINVVPGVISYTWILPAGWIGSPNDTSIYVMPGTTGGIISVIPHGTCVSGPAQTLLVNVITQAGQPGAITGPNVICSGTSHTYSITPVTGASGYTWVLPSGWTGSSNSDSIQVTAGAVNGIIQVYSNSFCGLSQPETLQVIVLPYPVQPGPITGNTSICYGSAGMFTIVPVPGALSYQWNLPQGWSGSSSTNSITVTSGPAGGVISVAGINSCGMGNPVSLTVSTDQIPSLPGPITGNSAICPNTQEIYSVPNDPVASSYTWVLPSGWSGSSSTSMINALAGSLTGNISVSATNHCGTSSIQTLGVVVHPIPTVPAISFLPVLLSSSSPSGNQWLLNGIPIPGAISQTYVPLQNGNYTVLVTDSNNCFAISAIYQFTSLGIEQFGYVKYLMFPNPVKDILNIQFPGQEDLTTTVLVINLLGETILTQTLSGKSELNVDVKDLSAGIYILQVTNGNNINRQKFIKE